MLQPGHDHVACPRTQFFPQPRQAARSGSTATSNSACPGCTALKQKRIASGLTPVRTPIRTQTRRSRVLSGFTCSAVRRMLSTIEASCMQVPQRSSLSLSTRVAVGAHCAACRTGRGACRTRTLQIAEWPVELFCRSTISKFFALRFRARHHVRAYYGLSALTRGPIPSMVCMPQ